MKVETAHMDSDRQYSARGIVARLEKIGTYNAGMLMLPVYRFITMDCGKGREHEDFAVKYVGKAPFAVDELTGEKYLDMSRIKEGQVVVHPGFIYERVEWTTSLRLAHASALQKYKRKDIILADKADAPSIELPTMDFTQDQVTKQ